MKPRAMLISFAMLIVLCSASTSWADAILSVSAPSSVTKGTSFTVDVDISDVTDLYAYEFDLGLNPSILKATSVTEGPFLASGGSTFFFDGGIDNFFGSIPFITDALLGASNGVSGSGELVAIQFTALTTGSSGLNISNELLSDSNFNLISDSVKNGTVKVASGTVKTPEPSTMLMLVFGVVLLAGVMQASKIRICTAA